MLRIRGERVRWQRSDVLVMADLVGPETAVRKSAALNTSILKLAKRKGLRLSPRAERALADYVTLAMQARAYAKDLDAAPQSKLEERAFKHQRSALAFFRNTGLPSYLLADEAGVGKTLAALLFARERGDRTLIICPNSAKQQWANAITHWIGARELITVVQAEQRKQKVEQQRALIREARLGWVVGHWESLVNAQDAYREDSWDTIILDEAHRICNRDTQRSAVASKLDATYRLALTAHPFTNDESELFGILQFLYPDRYTSFWAWVHLHMNVLPLPYGGHEFQGLRRPKTLKWELAPIVLRRTKQQVFPNLPTITRVPRIVELTQRGQREYARLQKQFFAELDALGGGEKTVVIPSELPRLTRLRQYLIDPGLLGGREKSLKYPQVRELLDDIGQPTVVFSSFRESIVRLSHYLSIHQKRVGIIVGGMTDKIEDIKRRFQRGKYDAILVVAQAGSESLNLGGFGYGIHLDLPFHPRGLEQSEGRVDRPQENTGRLVKSTFYRIVVANSYEETLAKKLEDKHARFGRVFTKGQLRELFA